MKRLPAASFCLALSLVGGQAAFAHAKLVGAEPAINGVAKAPPQALTLMFSEEISGKLSGATVTGADGKAIPATATLGKGSKGLMVTPKASLKHGVYTVDWHAVASDDGHRTTGTYKFTVN